MGALFGVGFASTTTMAHQDWKTLSIGVAVAVFSSILPDLDHDGSYISKYLTFNSKQQNRSIVTLLIGIFVITLCLYQDWPIWTMLAGLYIAIAAYVPHRSFTHSFLGVGLAGMIGFLASPNLVYFGFFMAGYLSHLFADALTVSGIPLLWPKKMDFRLAKIKTSTKWDVVIRYASGIFAVMGFGYLVI